MSSVERDASRSRDSDARTKPSYTGSDSGKSLVPHVPMWDSSDPERAPPPLPMNPGSPSVASRANTSSAIKVAHAALSEKARESAYTINPRNDPSPERSLIKGATHKRMQSLQTGNVKDLSLFIEGGSPYALSRSPEKSTSRPSTPQANKDFLLEPEKIDRASTPPNRASTPPSRDKMSRRDSLTLRPSLRRPPQSILGENIPPQSATMQALQNMASRDTPRELDPPLAVVTNGSTALVRAPQTFDAISNQILSLTSICTSLQREMAQLSRRSKDNATDLVSLKEATNSRDEDIRKSLRELLTQQAESTSRSAPALYGAAGGLFLDNKPHNSLGSKSVKQFSLPRIPSPNSFAASFDRESVSTPSLVSDSAVSIALLEKILRDMGTKDGQEQLVSRLSEVADRLARDGMSTAKKLEDLVQFIKDNTTSQELIAHNGGGGSQSNDRKFSFDDGPRLELDFERARSGPFAQRVDALMDSATKEHQKGANSDAISEDILKIIRTVKDSVAQGGGLTAEVKALVRELRGEVLGMGRDIGRKLEEAGKDKQSGDEDQETVTRVVNDGLNELKEHMDSLLREHLSQSSNLDPQHNIVDYQEIYNAVKAALGEIPEAPQSLDKEEIMDAVKKAWENHDLEITYPGIERDEILECLKEGFREFAPQENRDVGGATREEVFAAVVEGLKHFAPPRVEVGNNLSRDEILDAVRECLEEFEFPSAPLQEPRVTDITRRDMLDAVKEGLHSFDFGASKNAISKDLGSQGLSRDDVYDAVKAGLETAPLPTDTFAEQVLQRLIEVTESMRSEFKAVSEEAKENVAANGRDTEQLLDFTKDGFERLRVEIETYVDRVVDISLKDEILDSVHESFMTVRAEIEALISRDSDGNSMEKVQEELERLRQTVGSSLVQAGPSIDKDEIIDVLREGLESLRADIDSPRESGDMAKIQDEIERLRETISTSLSHNPTNADNSHEIISILKDGLVAIHVELDRPRHNVDMTEFQAEIERLREAITNSMVPTSTSDDRDDRFIKIIEDGLNSIHSEIERPRDDDGINKIQQELERLRDTMTNSLISTSSTGGNNDEIASLLQNGLESLHAEIERSRDDGSIEKVYEELERIRESMSATLTATTLHSGPALDKDEILSALKEGLDELRTDLDRPRDGNESTLSGTGEILDAMHDGLNGLRAEVEKIGNKPVDMTVNYEILDTLKAGLESVRAEIDKLRETAAEQSQTDRSVAQITDGAIVSADADGLKRNDIENLEVLITQLRIKVEALESMPPPPMPVVPGSVSKDDLATIEELIRSVQESIVNLAERDPLPDIEAASKEDVEAIETLLRNTKAKIDEVDPEQTVKKDDLALVETAILEAKESMVGLTSHLLDVSKRDDVGMVETLVREVVVKLGELKEKVDEDSQDLEKVTKTDVEAVEAVCLDVKTAIEQMVLTDIAGLASGEEVQQLSEMVKEIQARVELHAETHAQSSEERQAETVGVGERVSEVRTFLEEFRDVLKDKLEDGAKGVESLGKFLGSLGETIMQNASITDDIKELFETMKLEFEKSNAGVVGSKLESDEKFQQTWDKFDAKLDEKCVELISKYDDAQLLADAKAAMADEKNAETVAAMLETKKVVEDVSMLLDTLNTNLTESVDKMDESSKTVFNRVDETFNKVGEIHTDAKAEHQLTRDELVKTFGAVEGVQGHVNEYHPKILDSIKDVLLIVGQHYEHSKSAATTIQEKIADIPPPPEMPLIEMPPPVEKYDDTQMHEKLDTLVEHVQVAGKSFAQLEMLDKIHQQVMQTATEVSQFVSVQTQRIADDHEERERAAEAATISLEQRIAEKSQVEASVASLREEEDQLKASVAALKAQQEELALQKLRLSTDVSSLETALRIRREELHDMEGRAEGLERRILEGVIEHSRALLVSKSNRGKDAMSRKRVSSQATNGPASTASSSSVPKASSTTQSAVSMAMNGNRAVVNGPIASRRILSLSQITNNVLTGPGSAFQRSHSVKTPGGAGKFRKRDTSWGGSMSNRKYGDLNKENLAFNESEEDDPQGIDETGESDEETMRRSSHGTTVISTTETGESESTIDEGTEYTYDEDESEGETNVGAPVVLYEDSGNIVA